MSSIAPSGAGSFQVHQPSATPLIAAGDAARNQSGLGQLSPAADAATRAALISAAERTPIKRRTNPAVAASAAKSLTFVWNLSFVAIVILFIGLLVCRVGDVEIMPDDRFFAISFSSFFHFSF
jgi:hypothetical protein